MVLENEVGNLMKTVRDFLNQINIGYKSRSTFIKVRYTSEYFKIIQFFYFNHWIKLYSIEKNEILVSLRYINNKPLFIGIKFISTPGYRRYYTNKGFVFFRKDVGGGSRILLYTSYGLLGSKIVENLNIGGEVSYILYE